MLKIKLLLGIYMLCLVSPLFAMEVEPKSLETLLAMSDHVIIGTVLKVDMVDTNGVTVTDESATTGPGSGNTIRLHVIVKSTLKRTISMVPNTLVIPLWRMWNYSLGQVRSASEGETYVFLLKGPEFVPVYPSYFRRNINDRELIEFLLRPE